MNRFAFLWNFLWTACLFVTLGTLGIVSGSAQTQQPIFPTTEFTAPVGDATALATGDFNGDGQPDMAYISVPYYSPTPNSAPTLTVLLNQGANLPPIPVTTNSFSGCLGDPLSMVAADMNKDNKLDLVLACPAGFVAVLIGKGDGSFQPPAYYAVSGLQTLAPPVDLNGDGYPDVAASSLLGTSSSVAVLLNQGTAAPGTLSTAKSYPGPTEVARGLTASGDFNGDGKQDIVVGGTPLAIFYGNGDGTLQPAQTTAGGGYPVAGDFNHDGVTDIAYVTFPSATASGVSSLQVLLGSSSGTFTSGINLPLDYTLGGAIPFVVGTTNGGNNVNLALVGTYTSILLGDGNGGFSFGNSYSLTGYPAATETGSDGNTNLVMSAFPGFTVLPGNGDGTFQGILRIPLGVDTSVGGVPNGQFVAADLNGDGLTDVLGIDGLGNLISALGRGDGTLWPSNTTKGSSLGSLATGDFNGDGKLDVVGISANSQDSTLFFYAGNGNGTFQASLAGVDLNAPGAQVAVIGDFNGDNNLDLVVPYSATFPASGSGLIFLPGKGKGAFGVPVLFSQQNALTSQKVLVADLNNDKKLDLIWNGAVYLGNGDGTFQQMPLGLSGTPVAIADLNGDGIPDVVTDVSPGDLVNIYAGNGSGSFQNSPFYTVSLSNQFAPPAPSASVGDVNADGYPDLVLHHFTIDGDNQVTVFLGNGKGNFTLDTNAYYSSFFNGLTGGVLARLNNQAPKLPNDNALDYLGFTVSGVIPLLNQTNPKPTAPTPLASSTVLSVSANSAGENQQLTLTATVTGVNPTGTVSFVSGGTTLGSGTVVNGVATVSASFAAAGTYAVTANYAGDSENLPSISSPVTIVIAAPDFTVTASPTSGSISPGQSTTFTFKVSPVAGYAGTVKFSCGTLPSLAVCSFSPAIVTPSGGSPISSTLTVTTAAATARLDPSQPFGPWAPASGLAVAGVMGFAFAPGKRRRSNRQLLALCWGLLLASLSLSIMGCGGGNNIPSNPGTPAGTYTISVSASGNAGAPQHAVSITLTVQ
jgi:hypothetical protein